MPESYYTNQFMGTYFKQDQEQGLQAKYGGNSPKCKQEQFFFEFLKILRNQRCNKENMQMQLQCHATHKIIHPHT